MTMMLSADDVVIDKELLEFLPAVSDHTQGLLEGGVLEDGGVQNPVVLWKDKRIVVDGHRRVGVARKHGLKFPVREMAFSSRAEVIRWMRRTQLERRNLNPSEKALHLAQYLDDEQKPGCSRVKAAQRVAEIAGVDKRTVYRAKEYADALASLPDDIRSRADVKAAPQYVIVRLAEYVEMHQRGILAELDRGEYETLAEAVCGIGQQQMDEEPIDDTDVDEEEETEASCDTVSQYDQPSTPTTPTAPRQPQPARKPINDSFVECLKLLGKVASILESLKRAKPTGGRFQSCRENLTSLSDSIEVWRKD